MQENHLKSYNFFKITIVSYFLVFLVFISLSRLAGEDDLFWYLSTGRYIVQNGIVPSADIFGFTTSGMLWVPFEWAWDVINYYLFIASGYTALGILCVLLVILLFVLLFLLISKFNINYLLAMVFLLLLSFGIMPRLSVKPHLISYLGFAIVLTLVVRYRYFKRDSLRSLYFMPIIFFIWANMHMGVLAGLSILGVFLLSEIAGFVSGNKSSSQHVERVSTKHLLQLVLIFAASLLVTFLTPNGFKTYEYAFRVVSLTRLQAVNEWASPFSSLYIFKFHNFVYYLFILGLMPVIYYSYKKRDIFPALLNIGFFLYSVRANRFTIDFMIISVLFLTISIHFITEKYQNTRFYSAFYKTVTTRIIFSILLLFLIVNAMNNNIYRWTGYPRKFGIGIDEGNFPVTLFRFIKDTRLTESGNRPFNTYETGGYFIWNFPDKKNFIGSRTIDDKVWDDYTKIINVQPGFESTIDSINFDYFIWMVPLVNYSQAPALLDYGIVSYLFREKDKWKLIYWDDKSFCFVKNIPIFDQIVLRYEYKYITPFNFYFNRDLIEKGFAEEPDTILREIDRKQREDPYGKFQIEITKAYKERLEKLQ